MTPKCKCGNGEFTAEQTIFVNIIVDGEGGFIRNESSTIEESMYDGEVNGPYICTKCGECYDDLENLLLDVDVEQDFIDPAEPEQGRRR